MALAERLKSAQESYNESRACKLISETQSASFSDEDIAYLAKVINASPGHPDHIPNSHLSVALRQEGLDVSPSAVDRHRRGTCSCGRKARRN